MIDNWLARFRTKYLHFMWQCFEMSDHFAVCLSWSMHFDITLWAFKLCTNTKMECSRLRCVCVTYRTEMDCKTNPMERPTRQKKGGGETTGRWEDGVKITADPNWRKVAQDRASLEETFTQSGVFFINYIFI